MMNRRSAILGMTSSLGLAACHTAKLSKDNSASLEVLDPEMNDLFPEGSEIEVLATGFAWSEGPTWDRAEGALYFTDVPSNKAYKWTRAGGTEVFLDPSGTGHTEGFREPGANGLWYSKDGRLIACNHGLRRVEKIDPRSGEREVIIDQYEGQKFNSPNDVVEASDGSLYFTDPPYGLEGLDASPLKEMSVNGVYRVSANGDVTRLLSDMTFPNGVALSPDGAHMYVSQSDEEAPYIRRLTLDSLGKIVSNESFFDASSLLAEGLPGLPDGMAVSASGHLFATGPGGVLVLSANGKLLGRILTGRATANCAFGEDGSTLFITAHDRLLRLPTRVTGLQWS